VGSPGRHIQPTPMRDFTPQKGTNVTPTELAAKNPAATGSFATLRAFLHLQGSGAPAIRPARALLAAVLGLAALLALTAAPASAKIVHTYKFSLDGSTTPAGKWGSTTAGGVPGPIIPAASPAGAFYVGIHSEQSSIEHDLYDEFTSAGAYSCQITGAGESSASASECDTGAPGLPAGYFQTTEASGALDSSTGTIYIGDSAGVVRAFTSAGAYLPAQSFAVPAAEIFGLAVD
jgi:hypothetical protein